MASLRKRGRIWYYSFIDSEGTRIHRRGCPDKRETEAMAGAAEVEASKGRAGLIDTKAENYRDHESRPLSVHLDDFETALLAKGGTVKHASLYSERARRVVALARGTQLDLIDLPQSSTREQRANARESLLSVLKGSRLSHLSPSRIQGALATLKSAGRSLQTCNHHRSAIRAFVRWAFDDGRMRDVPLHGVTGYNVKEDRRHDRRTLSLDELRRLIVKAQEGPTYRKMTGSARALCYRLAVSTGLRYAEIKSVRPVSLDLAGSSPTVTVAAGYTKNGEPTSLPLPADVAVDLARFVAAMPTDASVFPLPEKGSDMLRVDLAAADIPYKDAAGLVFDFHALRCQCATLADAAGVSPRVVQKLMRHSTLELTGRYTRPRAFDMEKAASTLPSLRPDTPKRETAATGTHGQHIDNSFGAHLAHAGDVSSRIQSDADAINETTPGIGGCRNTLEMSELDASGRALTGGVATSGVRTRTGDLRIMRPPL
jgi:integrase